MSELRELSNERLAIAVSDHGAELSRIYDKQNGYEVLWNADPAFWQRHAPVLFPIVGRLSGGKMRWHKKTYEMGQHGFARDMEFALIRHAENSVTHRLQSDAETRKKYPFSFTLEITHTLNENEILIDWNVQNDTDGEMYFSIGGHPAFFVPPADGCSQTDFFLKFGGIKELSYIGLDTSDGTAVPSETYPFCSDNGIFPITEHMFDSDALVFEHNQVNEVSILWPDKAPYLTLHCDGFPYLAVWSKPGSPFICLEPWFGRTDDRGFLGEFSEKTGIQKLNAGCSFHTQSCIEIH